MHYILTFCGSTSLTFVWPNHAVLLEWAGECCLYVQLGEDHQLILCKYCKDKMYAGRSLLLSLCTH
jgi:hypothetical protein